METLKYLFGPVPSRRLGRSLGVNVVPSKICSMNCIYCEVGKTKTLSTSRKPYIKADAIINEFKENYNKFMDQIDVITITGAGEPTLNSELPAILKGIKAIAHEPIAILTNSTMLGNSEVFDTLLSFDIVVPSLDAASEDNFKKVTLAHPNFPVAEIISNLQKFSLAYKGDLFLEILLCGGVNDEDDEVEKLILAVKDMKLTKIQLGTIARPPAFSDAKQVDDERMLEIAKHFAANGLNVEIISGFKEVYKNAGNSKDLKTLIAAISKMRPCSIADFSAVFGEKTETVEKVINELLQENEIVCEIFGNVKYYIHPSVKNLKK